MANEEFIIQRSTLERIGNSVRAKEDSYDEIPVIELSSRIDDINAYKGERRFQLYNVGDVVLYEGNVYRCISSMDYPVDPGVNEHWEMLNIPRDVNIPNHATLSGTYESNGRYMLPSYPYFPAYYTYIENISGSVIRNESSPTAIGDFNKIEISGLGGPAPSGLPTINMYFYDGDTLVAGYYSTEPLNNFTFTVNGPVDISVPVYIVINDMFDDGVVVG